MSTPIRIFTDGACSPNPGNMGIGVVVEWQGKTPPTIISEYAGKGTNNIAEYTALNEALLYIYQQTIKNCVIHSDSKLMVNQVNGNWKCKDSTLLPLCIKAQERIKWLRKNLFNVELVYIKRDLNLADEPAKQGSKKFQ